MFAIVRLYLCTLYVQARLTQPTINTFHYFSINCNIVFTGSPSLVGLYVHEVSHHITILYVTLESELFVLLIYC